MAPARTQPADDLARIDLTPVVGVLLALLTMVMVTMPVVSTAWRVEHPPMDGMYGDGPAWDPVVITVEASGGLRVGPTGKVSSPAALARDVCVAQLAADQPGRSDDCHDRPVFVRAEPETDYAPFLATLQSLKAAGFRVDFLNEDVE